MSAPPFAVLCALLMSPSLSAAPRVALVMRGPVETARLRAVLEAAMAREGFSIEADAEMRSLVAEAARADRVCPAADAACWAKVRVYAGFENILVATSRGDAGIELVLVEVTGATRSVLVANAGADAVADAVRALLSRPPAPAATTTAEPVAPIVVEQSSQPSTGSVLWASAGGFALGVGFGCAAAATALDLLAADHIEKLDRRTPAPLTSSARARQALDAEALEIASLVCAGIATALGAAGAARAISE